MFGMGDFSIFLVYTLCILSAVACVVYGIINWNKGVDEVEEINTSYEEEEKKIKENLDI